AAGLPLVAVRIPSPCPNETYEAAMAEAIAAARVRGITGIAFGDLFLEEIRRYRERQMSGTGLQLHFPLWGGPTPALAEDVRGGAPCGCWVRCCSRRPASAPPPRPGASLR